jgi:DNA-directed RNA polymerase specialized sigma24 family protein
VKELTVADLDARMESLERQLAAAVRRQEEMNAIVILLMGGLRDTTHLSIEEAAKATHVSTRTVWRRIRRGEYRLEMKPGTREQGIPIEQVFGGWISVAAARTAIESERRK